MTIRQFAQIVEIRTKIIGISTFSIATLYVVFASGAFSLGLFSLTFITGLCVDMGTTSFDSYFDFVRGVDNQIYNTERDKVLVHEGVSPQGALAVSLGLYGAAVVLGVALASLTSYWVAVAGAASMTVGFLYTGGPYPISRAPVGELFAGGFLGTVFFLIVYFVHARTIPPEAVFASLPSTLLIMSILTVNNTCDIEADRAAGRITISILLGRQRSEVMVYVLGGLGYAGAALLSVLRVLPIWTLIPLAIAIGMSIPIYRAMHRAGFSSSTKGSSMTRISWIFLLFSVAAAVGLVVGLVLKWTVGS